MKILTELINRLALSLILNLKVLYMYIYKNIKSGNVICAASRLQPWMVSLRELLLASPKQARVCLEFLKIKNLNCNKKR